MSEFALTVARAVPLSAAVLYRAWTTGLATWFAAPDTLRMMPEVGAPFFFELEQRFEDGTPAQRHPHHGRVLAIEPDRLVRLSWVTGADGTGGAETILSLHFEDEGAVTQVMLTHERFATESARDRHAQAWPAVLAVMEEKLTALGDNSGIAPDALRPNRSIPHATFIPVRSYPDLTVAQRWLCTVFGARVRLRIGDHRVQFTLGNGAMVAAQWNAESNPASGGRPPATLMVRVANIDDTYARALAEGGTGVSAPADQPYGERQAVLKDPAGHSWTLTETIADSDPASWGGDLR